jgi:hypothetical protein
LNFSRTGSGVPQTALTAGKPAVIFKQPGFISKQSPLTVKQSPFTVKQLPFTSEQSGLTSKQSPLTVKQLAFTFKQLPPTAKQLALTAGKSAQKSNKPAFLSKKWRLTCLFPPESHCDLFGRRGSAALPISGKADLPVSPFFPPHDYHAEVQLGFGLFACQNFNSIEPDF